MKLISVLFLIACSFSSVLSAATSPGRCPVNVCFAIDGSFSVGNSEFRLMVDFALDLLSLLYTSREDGITPRIGAVQYANRSYEISRISDQLEPVAIALNDARPKGGSTSVAAGIDGCSYQLAHSPAGLPIIILIGDGRNNLGHDPVQAANMFRQQHRNGEIRAVAVGNSDISLLQTIANDKTVYAVNNFDQVIDIFKSILDVAARTCGLN